MKKEYTWKSDIAQKSQQFLQIKRITGFKYDSQEKYLQRFDTYYYQNGYTGIRITKEMADGFIYCQDERTSGWYVKERLIRDFALFLKDLCYSEIYVPIIQSAPQRSSFTPYIFTNDEIKRFFEAVDSWEDSPLSNRVIIDPVFFRLLYSTGMRLSEALNLTVKDFNNAVLTVYHAKNNKDRLVPLHSNMAEKLKTYTEHMHRFSKKSNYLFPSSRGYDYRIDNSTIHRRFRQYLSRAGISLTGTGPRIHCLRHNYAVKCLKKWVLNGNELTNMLPYLAAFMGHSDFRETQYYIRLTADLYPDIISRTEAEFGYVIPEGGCNNEGI
ncbi:MAG TPA: tyrosine-type recombinase/integrase [Chitinispirillaceae bacterium]|nr:tyrosine-type recombinase/integrase [Chitinispirillaceae bacterium]